MVLTAHNLDQRVTLHLKFIRSQCAALPVVPLTPRAACLSMLCIVSGIGTLNSSKNRHHQLLGDFAKMCDKRRSTGSHSVLVKQIQHVCDVHKLDKVLESAMRDEAIVIHAGEQQPHCWRGRVHTGNEHAATRAAAAQPAPY